MRDARRGPAAPPRPPPTPHWCPAPSSDAQPLQPVGGACAEGPECQYSQGSSRTAQPHHLPLQGDNKQPLQPPGCTCSEVQCASTAEPPASAARAPPGLLTVGTTGSPPHVELPQETPAVTRSDVHRCPEAKYSRDSGEARNLPGQQGPHLPFPAAGIPSRRPLPLLPLSIVL